MTEHRRPPACHYDRTTKTRTLRDGNPCPENHCLVCGRAHHPNAGHPIAGVPDHWTCTDCVKRIKDDLTDIQACYTALHFEALEAGNDGRLVAAAPIPGGIAQVLVGPYVRLDLMRVSRAMLEAHRRTDPLPPLTLVAQWERVYRAWLDHDPARRVTADQLAALERWLGRGPDNAPTSIAGAIRYLTDQVPFLADHHDPNRAGVLPPDFRTFARQVRSLRADLERALHDEREPEVGVECFECGDRLVRRFRDPKRCRHATPARDWFRASLQLAALGYPELGPNPAEVRATRRPCGRCTQGGLDEPAAGRAWECPSCRKEYTPGEYATAMRRDLLENGDQGDGWTHIRMAADAATTLVGLLVPEATVRKWMDRGKVAGLCEWAPGRPWGQRLVFWPDVAAEAVDAVARAQEAERRRRERLAVEARWRDMVEAGMKPKVAAKRLGIDKGWLSRLLDTVAA